jgi:hypothetical protein
MAGCRRRGSGRAAEQPLGDVWLRGWEAIALLSRLVGIIVAILIIVWIVSNPAAAGDSVHGWITGIFTFFRHLI